MLVINRYRGSNMLPVDSVINVDMYLHKISLYNSLIILVFRYYRQYYVLSVISLRSLSFTDSIVDVNSTQPFNPAYNIRPSFCNKIWISCNCFSLRLGYLFSSVSCLMLQGLNSLPLRVDLILILVVSEFSRNVGCSDSSTITSANSSSGISSFNCNSLLISGNGVTMQFLT